MRVFCVFNAVLDNRILGKYQAPIPTQFLDPHLPHPNHYSVIVCRKLSRYPLKTDITSFSVTINVAPPLELDAITFGMTACCYTN